MVEPATRSVTVKQIDPPSMVLFRGDLDSSVITKGLGAACGIPCPGKGQVSHSDDAAIAWMAPDECLIFIAPDRAASLCEAIDAQFAGRHTLCVDVSAMRAMFEISGTGIRDTLARGAPVDVSPASLPVGHVRRSRIGQVQAAFWLTDAHVARIICRRSEASYMLDWLTKITGRPGPDYFSSAS